MNRQPSLRVEKLVEHDHDSVARLLHQSLFQWYESRLGQGARFGQQHEPYRLIPDVYAELDPGEGLAARDPSTRELLGVCFVHPRPTHLSVGIVAVSATAQGRGVARSLLEPVIARAKEEGKPLRLVSSALNLDSFSLYTRLGFVPQALYQDLTLAVPTTGLLQTPPLGVNRVRLARPDEAHRLAAFEESLQGVSRAKDYQFFLTGRTGAWRVWVFENEAGELRGFIAGSVHPSSLMLGPGVASDDEVAMALVWIALDSFRGHTPLLIAPCSAAKLVRTAYSWGARNVELHVAQVLGRCPPAKGISFPTFLPESG